MFKRSIVLGLASGLLAAIASVIYQKVYTSSLGADFSAIAKPANIFASSIFGAVLAAIGFWLLNKWLKKPASEVVFNFIFVILSFASVLVPFATKLPFNIEAPELFPGLTVPMHFFPALAWFTLKPLFIRSEENA